MRSSRRFRPRAALAPLIALAAALAIAVVPATQAGAAGTGGPAGTDGAAATAQVADLNGLTLTSVNNGRNLDVQNGNTGDGVFLVTNSAPGHHQEWSPVLRTDGSFTLVNDATGKCAAAGLPLRQQTCSGAAGQRWYFQPVSGAVDTYMVRNAGDHRCLDVVLAAQYDDAWTQTYGCNGSRAQQWRVPAWASAAAFDAAVQYAANRCQQDASTCSWRKGVQEPAAPLPTECVSPVWYNGTAAAVPWTFSLNTSSGWSSTLGVQFTSELGAGSPSPVQARVSLTISGSVTYDLREELGNSLTISIPPGQYGWVELSALATRVTGEWTFDAAGYPWTAQDTVTVPLRNDDQGGASVYLARAEAQFTGCGA
ncbi:RICIN domain-containing protein [Allostreptomyces psammosilenae]|uniref:Ricin B lectin domain-containing protein n=1 Tax=Allostreptomyces psammosilenae TaxID=1892865 RepID=A0A852ZV37_9ACTN|nr:RICIN domain-containing protein [Allostreptomyces psammosilenae]NYI04644.1 hypothetical protein [Allostreptomyces psammosilenae]